MMYLPAPVTGRGGDTLLANALPSDRHRAAAFPSTGFAVFCTG